MNKDILAIHFGHDATVVYLQNGKVVEAMSEERLSRQKKHIGFPHKSLAYVKKKYALKEIATVYLVGDLKIFDTNIFVTEEDNKRIRSTKPHYKDYFYSFQFSIPGFKQALEGYYGIKKFFLMRGMRAKFDAFLKKEFPHAKLKFLHHHLAHAWSTVLFMEDPQKDHLIFTLDGAGDDLSGSVNLYRNGEIKRLQGFPIDSSLGLVYSAVVDIVGMTRNEHEFKVMGLAPYAKASHGEEVYSKLRNLIWFDKKSMSLQTSIPTTKTTAYFVANNFHRYRFDSLAYGVQKLTETCIQDMVKAYIEKYNIHAIAVGGGVFMNVKANQTLLALKEVHSLTITPSCGDESLALGAAIYGFIHEGNSIETISPINDLYLGSEYSLEEIQQAVEAYSFSTEVKIEHVEAIETKVAQLLAQNHVVGRFRGRAEWGARALGNRSILANPSSRDNIKLINEMIKGRDFWMPFATSLLYEDHLDYLSNDKNFFAPYMSITFPTKEKAHREIIAALHPYDLTSRPQMVTKDMNADYHKLISEYKAITGSSGILNTSFNLHGEPNVEAPYDAIRTFDKSGLQYLAIGPILISKQ